MYFINSTFEIKRRNYRSQQEYQTVVNFYVDRYKNNKKILHKETNASTLFYSNNNKIRFY